METPKDVNTRDEQSTARSPDAQLAMRGDGPVPMPTMRADSAAPPWVHGLVRLMDEAIPIPGTKIRIGWDAIVGFAVPVVGDAASALSHVTLLFYAFRARVSKVVLARMVLNVLIDELWGSVPIVGDLFDAGFRANRKNLELIDRGRNSRRATGASDYLVVYGAIAAVLAIVALPLILIALLTGVVVQAFKG